MGREMQLAAVYTTDCSTADKSFGDRPVWSCIGLVECQATHELLLRNDDHVCGGGGGVWVALEIGMYTRKKNIGDST